MDHSSKTGFSFGITSAIITTLGLIVGLHSGTHSRLAVIGGIIIIAVADAFSDSLGIHISEESENQHTKKEIWKSMLFTFLSKFIFAMTFVVPTLLLPLTTAIIVGIIWGMSLLGIFSFYIARSQKAKAREVVSEHLGIALVVIIITHFIGDWIGKTFS